jgi:prophage regulatory protein
MKKENVESMYEPRLIRINEVAKLTTLSRSCINLWVAQGRFPAPLTLSPTVKVWRLKHLLHWIESQSNQGDSSVNSERLQKLEATA